MGQSWGTFMLFICVVAQMFCLTASVTSASRMMFAFSRDRAVPGHQLWRQVSANRIPRNAVIAICVLAAALMLPTLYNFFIGYYVGTGIAVIGLYIAFILPVILRFRMGDAFEHGAWSLGNHYKWIDPIAIVWVFFISIVFLMPAVLDQRAVEGRVHLGSGELRADPRRRRVAPLRRLVGALGKKWFKGPVRMGTEEELERLEEEQAGSSRIPTEARAYRQRRRGAPPAPLVRSGQAPRRSGDAAVLSSRSKCSSAYAVEVEVELETADCTTPHIASRKSDMKRISSSASRLPCARRRSRPRAASRSASASSSWLIEKFARSKNRSPMPAYSQSTMQSRSPSSRKFAFSRSL